MLVQASVVPRLSGRAWVTSSEPLVRRPSVRAHGRPQRARCQSLQGWPRRHLQGRPVRSQSGLHQGRRAPSRSGCCIVTPRGGSRLAAGAQGVELCALWCATASELRGAKQAIACGGGFLGLSGSLLEDYARCLTEKESLLSGLLGFEVEARRTQGSSLAPRQHVGRSAPQLQGDINVGEVEFGANPPAPTADEERVLGAEPAWSAASASVSATSSAAVAAASGAEQRSLVARTDAGDRVAGAGQGAQAEVVSVASPSAALDGHDLAAVLRFLAARADDACCQRRGVSAIRRLARDEAQMRSQCLAAAEAVMNAIVAFPSDLPLQRLAAAALGNLVYIPEVAPLMAEDGVRAVLSAMVAHDDDKRLQDLASESLARFAQAGTRAVVSGIFRTLLDYEGHEAVHVCCGALMRLWESGICESGDLLEALAEQAEDQPESFALQQRASSALQWLVHAGAIDAAVAKRRAPFLDAEWVRLLARFAAADQESSRREQRFHADLQAVFHEEVAKRFEYEAAVRCLEAAKRREGGVGRLREVLCCLVENLEDYQGRLEVRELAWDADRGCLQPLNAALRRRLLDVAVSSTEGNLAAALRAAAGAEGPDGEELLERRAASLRAECEALLRRKTLMTQTHQEQTRGLRPENILFEALCCLERRIGAVAPVQLHAAERMFAEVERTSDPEAVEHFQRRLARLVAR